MIELVAYYILGGFSLGYGLVRIGFPQIQQSSATNKLLFGFIAGTAVFGLSAMLMMILGDENSYFLISGFLVLFSMVGLLIKRIIFNETDIVLEEEKPKRKATMKEKAIAAISEPITPKKRITFEEGLMVKGKNEDSSKTKKQALKLKEGNILNTLQSKTKDIENETNEKRKNEALEKLRQFAQQISETKKIEKTEKKKKPVEEDELEEDLLNNLGDEEITGEEEY